MISLRRSILGATILSCAASASLIGGCGVSYNVAVENATDAPLHVEIFETFAGTDHMQLATDVAPATTFRFSMDDGNRSDGKGLFIHPTADASVPAIKVPIAVGERLFAGSTRYVVTRDGDRLVVAGSGPRVLESHAGTRRLTRDDTLTGAFFGRCN